MKRSEKAILTVLCMITDGNKILLQDRVKDDWYGYTLPGGHVEKGESFVQAAVREVYEETGLVITNPQLCGVKQFQTEEEERYIVFLFKTDNYSGTLVSSEEGEMHWVDRAALEQCNLVDDFMNLLKVFDSEEYSEFIYENKQPDDPWVVKLY